jgi:hypothetical protein
LNHFVRFPFNYRKDLTFLYVESAKHLEALESYLLDGNNIDEWVETQQPDLTKLGKGCRQPANKSFDSDDDEETSVSEV